MVNQTIRPVLVLLYCITLLKLEAVSVHGQLLGSFFSKCRRSEIGCFMGLFGYTMHKNTDGKCSETCTMFPRLKSGWNCGPCIVDVTPTSPINSPVSSPIAPIKSPVVLPVSPPVGNTGGIPIAPISPPVDAGIPLAPFLSPALLPVGVGIPIAPVRLPVFAPVSTPVGANPITPVVSPVSLPVSPPVGVNPIAPIRVPVSAPVSPPVGISPIAPVRSPVSAPVSLPTGASPIAPVRSPVSPTVSPPVNGGGNPTAPLRSPVTSPVSQPVNTQLGQYISSGYSERIVIPQPKVPNLLASRTNCPHLAGGLLDWHSSSTWPNTGSIVPTSGAVTLPENSKVVITKTVSELLGIITIPNTSSLIIGEDSKGIELRVRGMDVKGSLIAGSITCRIETPITITLSGPRPTNPVQNRPTETYKGISVTGTLSLHGKRYFRTWTRLAKSVKVGDNELILQDTVNWEVGQEIVLVTTAIKDSREWHQNEVYTIASIASPSPKSGTGTSVLLNAPVRYSHIANKGYQAEVGLLSRAIVIQGSAADSEPTDKDPLNCVLPNSQNRYGDTGAPCGFTEITGFGGHVIVHGAGRGYVAGVEFYRMGQTNVLGRYPIHFHLLGNCPDCYVTDSAFYRSYYRCVSIHGTNNATISENVAYDVTGYCYYLEDGVEENNTISFNLAALIHSIGPAPPGEGGGQTLNTYDAGPTLTLPADVTASGFYITNVHNYIIGNSASGGWAGFAFPLLPTALQTFQANTQRPSSVTSLTIDGNSAHSSGWWWNHAGAFYFGGKLFYESGVLKYNPGRGGDRVPCNVNACNTPNWNCDWGCPLGDEAYLRVTNSKAYLAAGVGLNSWTGRMEIVGWESHDTGLAMESLADSFWIDKALAVCRTGEALSKPSIPQRWQRIRGDGFFWYDTGQEHIITESIFRNCGFRSAKYSQYDVSSDRGCDDSDANGCSDSSTTFGFLTHSDQFTPELMQGTRNIDFDNCGRRFSLDNWLGDSNTVSGRNQNWLDADGSVSGLGVPSLIVSGISNVSTWWEVDSEVVYDPQGPLRFIAVQPRAGAPKRGLAHIAMYWDAAKHSEVGYATCGNGNRAPCPILGYIRHAGKKFSGTKVGNPVTARGEIVGAVGGYAWILEFDDGAPREIKFNAIEVLPETPLIMSIAYPPGTTFTITVRAADWCSDSAGIKCSETLTLASSLQQVRSGPGNQYFVDSDGVVTFRIAQHPNSHIGRPNWYIPSRTDLDLNPKIFAVSRFERSGVYLPKSDYGPSLTVKANCGGSGVYCSTKPGKYDPNVCPSGYQQIAYDYCCRTTNPSDCVFASN